MRWVKGNVGWLSLAFAITASLAALYAKAAQAETKQQLALMEDRFSAHVEAQRRTEDAVLRRDAMTQKKLDAICRALPNANCPLGVE